MPPDGGEKLMEAARAALKMSYCPYSQFAVGAAILGEDGRIFKGCNVEIGNLAGSICAERSAAVKAVSDGCRRFKAVAIASASGEFCWPCGICRQFMQEFAADLIVFAGNDQGKIKSMPLELLLPRSKD